MKKNPTFEMKTQHLFPLLKAQQKYSDTHKISTAKKIEPDWKHLVFQRDRIKIYTKPYILDLPAKA